METPKRRRGRPSVTGVRRAISVTAFVNQTELDAIRAAAQDCGLTMSDFIRNALAREIARTRRNGGRSGISVIA